MLSTIFIAFSVSYIATMIFLFVAIKMINKRRRTYFEMGIFDGYLKGYEDGMKGKRPYEREELLKKFSDFN